jgi:outer membrane protein OmpA-like peptidoglycan-associated protein
MHDRIARPMSSDPIHAAWPTAALAALFLFAPAAVRAEAGPLPFPPGAVLTAENVSGPDSFALPVQPFGAAKPMEMIEGQIHTRAARLDGPDQNTLLLIQAFRTKLTGLGYQILLDCDQASCGGFDFRFSLDTVLPPAMEVSLADYRFLSARGPLPSDAVAILVSRTEAAAFIQITRTGQAVAPVVTLAPEEPPVPAEAPETLAALEEAGRIVLEGLEFESGSSQLAADNQGILGKLALWLQQNPAAKLVLVGHSDNEGSLESNIAVSRDRAQSVRQELIGNHGIDADRLSVEGIGFLAPLTANRDDTARARNRRVEAVLR